MPGRNEGRKVPTQAGVENGVPISEEFGGFFQGGGIWLPLQLEDGDGEVMALAGAAHQRFQAEQKAVADGGMDRRIQRRGGRQAVEFLAGGGLLRADQRGDPGGRGKVVTGKLGGVDHRIEAILDGENELHDAHGVQASGEEVAFRIERFGGVEEFVADDSEQFVFHGDAGRIKSP